MSSQFQNLFENVCRCFGHNPTASNNNNNTNGDNAGSPQQQPIDQVSSTTSAGARRRTNRLELKDKQWDELFEKNQRGSQQQQNRHRQSRGQPPRPEGHHSHAVDHETAKALAQAKLAANPPRYRTKRKRSAQAREEIFRSKEDRNNPAAGRSGGRNGANRNGPQSSSSAANYTPQTDFSRLLNPSLALCFATPVRGTEEEPEEADMRSVDNSDTATLNTNGEDTITSTLYFDSKYAHIQETRPPMPLFNQFKIGQAKDEIRTIMATDSHSSLRMIKLMQQQQMTRDEIMEPTPEGDDDSSSSDEEENKNGGSSSRHNRNGRRKGTTSSRSPKKNNKKKDPSGSSHGRDHDEEMQDAVPDVKAVSSSTDSSRLSTAAAKHHPVV